MKNKSIQSCKAISVSALLMVLVLVVAGCNTFKGAGKDVENTGKNIQKTVD